MTKQKKKREMTIKIYGEGGYDWAFLLHVTDWRIMKGIPTPNPLSPTLTANQVTNTWETLLSSIPECICLQNEMLLKL